MWFNLEIFRHTALEDCSIKVLNNTHQKCQGIEEKIATETWWLPEMWVSDWLLEQRVKEKWEVWLEHSWAGNVVSWSALSLLCHMESRQQMGNARRLQLLSEIISKSNFKNVKGIVLFKEILYLCIVCTYSMWKPYNIRILLRIPNLIPLLYTLSCEYFRLLESAWYVCVLF